MNVIDSEIQFSTNFPKQCKPWQTCCAACGRTEGDFHLHHLVPRVHGGTTLPTVLLCAVCHGLVHKRRFNPNHAELTRRGLAAAKARGVKLGNPTGDNSAANAASTAKAAAFRATVLPIVTELAGQGVSCRGIARELNRRGVKTMRGKEWGVQQISRMLVASAIDAQ